MDKSDQKNPQPAARPPVNWKRFTVHIVIGLSVLYGLNSFLAKVAPNPCGNTVYSRIYCH